MSQAEREFCGQAIAYLKPTAPAYELNVVFSDQDKTVILSDQDKPVLKNLGNGLSVAYLVDQGDHFDYVQNRHLAATGISESELHQYGISNLLDLLDQEGADVHPYDDVFAVRLDGNFEASLMLIDDFWDQMLAHLAPNGFIAAIPDRNILAFCDAGNAPGIQTLRRANQGFQEEEPADEDRPISPVLYRRHASKWTPYTD